MKHIIIRIITFVIFFCYILFVTVYGTEVEKMKLSSKVLYLKETTSDRILLNKNGEERVKIASLTKFMTALLACEKCQMTDDVNISKTAASIGGSTVGLKSNSTVKLESLLYGLLLESGNDCAIAIAEHVGGTVEAFVELMNERAYTLEAYNTVFSNPHGLDTEYNHSTAQDLYLIVKEAIKHEEIQKIINTKSISIEFGNDDKYLANTNRLLTSYKYCIGGKTGFTNGANRCLVAIAKKDDMQLVAIVLGANDTNIRFGDAKKMLEYGINNYEMVNICEYLNWYIEIPVFKGRVDEYTQNVASNEKIPLRENELQEIYVKQTILPMIKAPMNKGTCLGDISLHIKDEQLLLKSIYLTKDIHKKTFFDYIYLSVKNMFNIVTNI